MATSQPEWKCVGRLGDVDPITYGGGFVYEDSTGVYAPEVAWLEPGDDESYDHEPGERGEEYKLKVYRFSLERDPVREWWYPQLHEVAGDDETFARYREVLGAMEVLRRVTGECGGGDVMAYAHLMVDIGNYHGFENLDGYPLGMTEGEAKKRYAAELKLVW